MAESRRGRELRRIGALADFHLMKLRHYLVASLPDIGRDSLALRLKASPDRPRPVGRDPKVADNMRRAATTAEAAGLCIWAIRVPEMIT